MIIPAKIGSVDVTGIADGAFHAYGRGLTNSAYGGLPIKSVTFEDNTNFKRIGNSAFGMNTKITAYNNIPDSTTYIGADAFAKNPNLTTFTLPKSVQTIGNFALAQCQKLEEVIFPAEYGSAPTLTIGTRAFHYCDSLTDIYLKGYNQGEVYDAPWYVSNANIHWNDGVQMSQVVEGVDLYGNKWEVDLAAGATMNQGTDLEYTYSRVIKAYLGSTNQNDPNTPQVDAGGCFHVPDWLYIGDNTWVSVGGIDTGSLRSKLRGKGITEVKVDEGVKYLYSWVFYDMGLEKVDLGDLRYIGNWSFQKNNLTSLTLPKNLNYIGTKSFADNPGLKGTLTLPGKLINVDARAFSLISVENGVEVIRPNTGIDEVQVMQYLNQPSDETYRKAEIGVFARAPWGTGAGVNIYYRDTAVPAPTHESRSDSWDYKTNTAIADGANKATLLIHGYTNDNFAVVRHMEYKGEDIHVGDYPTASGKRRPAEGQITGIEENGDYEITLVSVRLNELNQFDLNNPAPSQVEKKYTATVDAFHPVTYDLNDFPNSDKVKVSGKATDLRGEKGYVQGYGVTADDGTDLSTLSTSGTWELEGWMDKDDPTKTVAPGGKITMPDRAMTLVPVLRDATNSEVKITFNGNGGTVSYLGQANPTMYTRKGALLTETQNYDKMTISRNGYRLAGWSTNSDENNAVNIVTYPVGNTTSLNVYAVWEKKDDIVVTFDGNGGYFGTADTLTSKVDPGVFEADLTVPVASRDGYEFAGWYADAVCSGTPVIAVNATDATYPAESTVYYAKWTAKPQPVTFEIGTDGVFSATANADKSKLSYLVDTDEVVGSKVKADDIAVTAKDGWVFNGWSDGTSLYNAARVLSVEVPAGGKTFIAWYTQKNKSAIYLDFDGGKIGTETYRKWTGDLGAAFNPTNPTWPTNAQVAKTGYTATVPAKPATYSDIPGEVTVVKVGWTPIGYNVVFNANAPQGTTASGSMNTQMLKYDEETKLTAIGYRVSGHTFQGCATTAADANAGKVEYADGAKVKNLSATNNATVNLYAVWKVNGYGISYDYDGGTVAKANPAMANAGDTVTLTAPTKTGYSFDGWTVESPQGTTVSNNQFTMPASNVSLKAKWTANSYTVIFKANGGVGKDKTQRFTYDQEKALETNPFTYAGYNFLGWSSSEGAATPTYGDGAKVKNLTSEANGTVTLYAVWSKHDYAIIYDYDGGSIENSNAATAKTGERVTLKNTPTKNGYTFTGWSSKDVEIANNGFTMPAKNVTIKAMWKAITYSIEYKTTEKNATGSMSLQTVTFGMENDTLTANAFEVTGKTFRGWATERNGEIKYADKAAIDPDLIANPAANGSSKIILYAVFSADGYAIIYDYDGGKIKGSNENIFLASTDQTVTLKSEPTKDGYTFNGWISDDVTIENNSFTMPGKNVTVKATWTADKHTVTYVMPHSDSANITEEVATDGKLANIPVSGEDFTVNPGYTFMDRWECSEGGTFTLADMAKYVMPSKNVTFTAVVVADTIPANARKLTFDAREGTFDGVNPLVVENGKVISLNGYKANAPDNKMFDGWADESGKKITSITMNGDKTVYALYKEDTSIGGNFIVTFRAGANGKFADGSTEFEKEVEKNMAVREGTIEEPIADENYTFIGWTLEGNDAIIPTVAISMISVTDNITYTAAYTKTGPVGEKQFTLTFDTGDSVDTIKAITMPEGEKVDVSVFVPTPPEDKVFDGWILDGEEVKVVTLDADKTVVAKYSDEEKYDVTFLEENGDEIETYEVVYGGRVEEVPEAETLEDKTFIGWTIGDDTTVYTNDAVKGYPIIEETTFTATYAEETRWKLPAF